MVLAALLPQALLALLAFFRRLLARLLSRLLMTPLVSAWLLVVLAALLHVVHLALGHVVVAAGAAAVALPENACRSRITCCMRF